MDAREAFDAWCQDASDENAQRFMVSYADDLLARLSAVEAERDALKEQFDLADSRTVEAIHALRAAEARVEAQRAVVEAARAVDRIYEGLRVDANDGTFSLWTEDDLVAALHELRPALAALPERGED